MSDTSRVEQLLRNALGEDIYEVTPQSRVEELLQQLNELIEDMDASVDPTVIESIVTAWLEENIHDGSAAIVDSSLTIAGAAADAKKTGDELSSVKENLNQVEGDVNSLKQYENIFTADVDESVQNWLDDHPEATTTVEDHSLTLNKFVLGANGFVTPEQFGAVGDGETDDTTAVKGAMDYAIANGCAVFIPQKTYIVTPTLTFTLSTGQSLVVFGAGQKSCLKRKADSLTSKWHRIIVVNPSSAMTAHAGDVIFSNFLIDSNRRNQSNATSGYEYEAAADICISNGSGTYDPSYQYIERVIIDRMAFFDPVADCFNFSGSGQVYVKNVWINGMIASGRQGTRNDIGFTGNPLSDVWIQNCRVGSIHFEYNATVSDENIITYHITDCRVVNFSPGGRLDLLVSNLYAKDFVLGGHRYAMFNNCYFDLGTKQSYIYYAQNSNASNKTVFSNCTFVHHTEVTDTDGTVTTKSSNLYIRHANVDFVNCLFNHIGDLTLDLDEDGINDHVNFSPWHAENNTISNVLFIGCTVSDVFIQITTCVTGLNVKIANMTVETFRIFNMSLLRANTPAIIRLDNVVLGEKCKRLCNVAAVNVDEFTLTGNVEAKFSNFRTSVDTTTAGNNFVSKHKGTLNVIVQIAEPLTVEAFVNEFGMTASSLLRLVKGTVFQGAFKEAPIKWIANFNTLQGITPSTWNNNFITIGTGAGDTASRPTCILSKGFQYFDTDLGKTIVWNGTTWVNVDGTALA